MTGAPQPPRAALLDVPQRVRERRPLCQADHAAVLFLIGGGYMHVTPTFDRTDPCPYLLTETGAGKLRAAQRRAPA